MSYKQLKANAIQKVMDWKNDYCNHDYSWGELAYWSDYFGKLAKRYGLIKEFRENGII